MKKSAVLAFVILFSLTVFAQKPRPTKKGAGVPKTKAAVFTGEKDEFEKAVAEPNAAERIMALNKFVESHPQSEEKIRALELIVSARAATADEKLQAGDVKNGVELFTLAVRNAPQPVSDKLFTEILLQIPTNLYIRGQQAAAIEIAKLIELKIETNANQMLGLATFYIGTENAAEARRIAEKVIQTNPNLPAAYQTLGLASRVNFQLDEAADAYAKALELDANSAVSKRSLAEMKRATGKPEEAIALYREILARDETDAAARTGLALALFNANQKTEAETETAKILDQNPGNLPLLVGAAYWYAAHDNGAKAVEFAQKAIAVEPRYTWSYIALARGLILQRNPLEAERVLLTAKQYGNFPTLDYEIASARLAAGFYREAAETLSKRFALKDGVLETKLGGRVPVTAENFTDLISLERRASIFEPFAADTAENSERIKRLLDFSQKINNADATDAAISAAADEFVKGDDRMKFHRQIFTANRLLDAKKDLPKVLELTGAAIGGVDRALEVSSPAAAVLADELYNSRQLAMLRGQLIVVPDVPQRTLSNILRGRIEDISGWTLYEQGKTDEAVIHLKRAVSVLPEKSSYWRDTLWRLGTALDSEGKSKEALDAFIKSYSDAEPSAAKRLAIEAVYQKINGNLDGLDAKIGESPVTANNAPPATTAVAPIQPPTPTEQVAQIIPKQIPAKRNVPTPLVQRTPAIEVSPSPEIKPTPALTPEITATPTPTPKPIVAVEPKATPTPKPAFTPTPAIIVAPKPTPTLIPAPEIKPTPETSLEAKILPKTTASPEITPEFKPTPEASSMPKIQVPSPTPELITETKPAPTPEQVARIEPIKKPLPAGNPQNTRAVIVSPPIVVTEEMPPVVAKKSEAKPNNAQNPMFESVIINVPKTENIQSPPKSGEQSAKTTNNARTIRPRFAPEPNSAAPPEQTAQCKIVVGQENISIINNGGNIGILAGYEKDGDLTQLTASSDSPNDIQVTLEPEIGVQSGRAFFIIRSISARVGVYNVTFDAPCGRKTIVVKVR